MIKKISIVILIIIIILLAVFVPIIPVPLPDGVWTKKEFHDAHSDLKKITDKLYFIEPDSDDLYYIRIHYGEMNMRKSLLGLRTGKYTQSTAQYSCWVPKTCPHLVYEPRETKIGHAYLRPDKLDDFMNWAKAQLAKGEMK
mgnify:CR=1 FL=1